MNALSRDQLLTPRTRRREWVALPELEDDFGSGCGVWVQALSAAQRDEFEGAALTHRGKDVTLNTRQLRARLVALAVCDDAGRPLFTPADVDALGEVDGAAVDRIFEAASRLARLTKQDADELGKVSGNGHAATSR